MGYFLLRFSLVDSYQLQNIPSAEMQRSIAVGANEAKLGSHSVIGGVSQFH